MVCCTSQAYSPTEKGKASEHSQAGALARELLRQEYSLQGWFASRVGRVGFKIFACYML